MTFEEKLAAIHNLIKECFGEAVIAKINVTNGGMEADISFKTAINGYTMRKINGDWVDQFKDNKSTTKTRIERNDIDGGFYK